MTIDNGTLSTLLWAVIALSAIQAFSTYALCRLFVTGRSMFDRKAQGDEDRTVARIHRADR